jgi:hypothetical protein
MTWTNRHYEWIGEIGKNNLLLSNRNHAILPVGNRKVGPSMKEEPDVLQGRLR